MSETSGNLPAGYTLFDDKSVTPEEILEVRDEQINPEEVDVWQKCIDQSLRVVGVRDGEKRLVGVAMLAGNQRHAELVDGTVHPDVRELGIGRVLIERLVEIAREEKIKYVGLTFDKTQPWLKEAYERHGFVTIDFAMWLKDSLPDSH
jgi:ribosomal protein S18 acetylase RimI-like enzyme